MKIEEIYDLISNLDDDHFAVVNNHGCVEVYSNIEFLATPIPVDCTAEKNR